MSSPEQAATTAVLWQLPAGAGAAPCMPHAATTTTPPSTTKITACSHRHHATTDSTMPLVTKKPPAMHNNQPCTSSPQARPLPSQLPSNTPHLKQDLYYSGTERRMQHPAQNLQRQTRERAPNTRDDPALKLLAYKQCSGEQQTGTQRGKTSPARPVDTQHTATKTEHAQPPATQVLCSLGSQGAPHVCTPPSFTRWAASLAWLCTACQPLFRATETRLYLRQQPNCARRPGFSLCALSRTQEAGAGGSQLEWSSTTVHSCPAPRCVVLCRTVQYSTVRAVLCRAGACGGKPFSLRAPQHTPTHSSSARQCCLKPTHPPTRHTRACRCARHALGSRQYPERRQKALYRQQT